MSSRLQVNQMKSWIQNRKSGSKFNQSSAQTASVLQPTKELPLKLSGREFADPKPWATVKSNKLTALLWKARLQSVQLKCCGQPSQKQWRLLERHASDSRQSHLCYIHVSTVMLLQLMPRKTNNSEEYVSLYWTDMSITVTLVYIMRICSFEQCHWGALQDPWYVWGICWSETWRTCSTYSYQA